MIKILSIKNFKEGDIITRVCPTKGHSGNCSFIGEKLKLIKLTNTDIVIDDLCDSSGGVYTIKRTEYEYGWTLYRLNEGENDEIVPYSDYKGQLRVQYVYLGIELDKRRGYNTDKGFKEFADYLTVCRYLESIKCSV